MHRAFSLFATVVLQCTTWHAFCGTKPTLKVADLDGIGLPIARLLICYSNAPIDFKELHFGWAFSKEISHTVHAPFDLSGMTFKYYVVSTLAKATHDPQKVTLFSCRNGGKHLLYIRGTIKYKNNPKLITLHNKMQK